MSEKASPARTVVQISWHLLRYASATCVSAIALAAVPILVVSAFVLFQLSGFVLFFLGLVPIEDPMSLVLVPLMLVLFEIVAVFVGLLLAAVVTVVGILPISLLVELVLWKWSGRRLSARTLLVQLMSFAVAGGLSGVLIGTVGLFYLQPDNLVLVGFVYLGSVLICTCAVFLFGLVLTLMAVMGEGILALERAITRKAAA
jgi:hypothetical protein